VNTTGADFVFDSAYQLPHLDTLDRYLQTNHHLPGVASASQMQSEGVELGAFTTKLLQKIEELTLYSVEADRRLEQLEAELKAQQTEIDLLKAQIQH
jgi:16S rRNA A1518/A1519 N6-dimethyltransferase RsmA/KsgA/DIM1 with predicted DNA glycosylase/AP lyase activity